MFAANNLRKKSFYSLSSLLHRRLSKSVLVIPRALSSNAVRPSGRSRSEGSVRSPSDTWRREMSHSSRDGKGKSMRSRVELRMQRETRKTFGDVQKARLIHKKLMTDNERLVYNLKRAKKKVAILLMRLKTYDLPELPASVHDPELLTPEHLQSYKKIGFKNKNYCQVGVRGVFGGVVENMHMHWKFHETVQVLCDNHPKEKIREMACFLARLSGGIVVNIHNTKTIIMFRGRNYRQPQNLIPYNTLTKRKALFKARFEQALESQKLNIKKIEQQLRQSGINPEDPASTRSIQRVASSFFNAIDSKGGMPSAFRDVDLSLEDPGDDEFGSPEPSNDRERKELDSFVSQIEEAAEREWAEEEAADREMGQRLMYWNYGDRGRYRRLDSYRDDRDIHETADQLNRPTPPRDRDVEEKKTTRRVNDNGDGDDNESEDEDEDEDDRVNVDGDEDEYEGDDIDEDDDDDDDGNYDDDDFSSEKSGKSLIEQESEVLGVLDNVLWNTGAVNREPDRDRDLDRDRGRDPRGPRPRSQRGYGNDRGNEEYYNNRRKKVIPYDKSDGDESDGKTWIDEAKLDGNLKRIDAGSSRGKRVDEGFDDEDSDGDEENNGSKTIRNGNSKSNADSLTRKSVDDEFYSGDSDNEFAGRERKKGSKSTPKNYDEMLTSDDEY